MATLTPADLAFRTQRRQAIARNPTQTGLDSISVERLAGGRWRLRLRFVEAAEPGTKRVVPREVAPANLRITLEGAFDPEVRVERIEAPDEAKGELPVIVSKRLEEGPGHPGADLPTYSLELVEVADLDPFFARAPFSFRPGEPGEVIAVQPRPPRRADHLAEIDYLAKDYASFRKLMLEQLTFQAPGWKERNPSDLGVTLVEVLAYAADYLSYYQDAVATEAYLRTARRRISVRRHARLLDYTLSEGANARVWAQVQVEGPPGSSLRLPRGTPLLTAAPLLPPVLDLDLYLRALAQGARVFETMEEVTLYPEQNRLAIYPWGSDDFMLCEGTTSIALAGHGLHLAAGDVIVFEEVLDAHSGSSDRPDTRHRHPVRLAASPHEAWDRLEEAAITEITWFDEDELPFDLAVSSHVGSRAITGITVARGNLVLADYGRTLPPEELEPVPAQGRYRPTLAYGDLTYRVPYDPAAARRLGAASALLQEPADTLPAIDLFAYPRHSVIPAEQRKPPRGEHWQARRDLLNSGRFAFDFTVETENDGVARLRFGDGMQGSRPLPGTTYKAVYRVGGGANGNIGPDAIQHVAPGVGVPPPIVRHDARLVAAGNQVPASGGTEVETVPHAQLAAPAAFRTQRRCVTPEDCTAVAEAHPEVLRATTRAGWTGSWQVYLVYVQRRGGKAVTDAFRQRIQAYLEPFALVGSPVEVRAPQNVPLHVHMVVTLAPDHFREKVRRQLSETFSDGELPTGGCGFFYPDDFGFGQPVYLSEVVARAMGVDGVVSVEVDVFHRWGEPESGEIASGRIAIGPLEIATLSNDPNAPQRGTLDFTLVGGR